MKIYGIKTCGSVKKATSFMNAKGIEFDFIDFKKENVDIQKIKEWVNKSSIDKVFNNKGTKYKTLNLKALNLDENGKIEWLAKENMLVKRPIIECDDGSLVVGFNEDEYNKKF